MTQEKPKDEDVLEFLDSLGPGSQNTPSNSNNTESEEKDVLGFLDSLVQSTAPGKEAVSSTDTRPKDANTQVAQERDTSSKPEVDTSSAEKIKKSAESIRSLTSDSSSPTKRRDPVASLTSWFGSSGIWDSASAAVKTAEAKMRDIQTSSESKAIESKVKENIDALNRFGISKTLASTFSTVLSTLAPPIMRHEQLRIHIFHDIVGYPAIDTIVYSVFDRVMQQVEGGELIIVQKGKESRRRDSDKQGMKRDMGLFQGGLEAGTKLAIANVEQIMGKGKEIDQTDGDSPIRKSDIYLSIQACSFTNTTQASSEDDKLFAFVIYLVDPYYELSYTTQSQSFPLKWCEWLDSDSEIPGQVDPREWIAEWVEEGLGLAVGVAAQRYVASRMAIGIDLSESEA
ncbi:maintenance of telomere capping protein 1 [Dipodascopsis uninucleata]